MAQCLQGILGIHCWFEEAVVLENNASRINNAVKACLQHCYLSNQPLAPLAEFVQMLHDDPAWTTAEIAVVESHVRHMLTAVVNPSDSGMTPSLG